VRGGRDDGEDSIGYDMRASECWKLEWYIMIIM
jgi:hypothetical protein